MDDPRALQAHRGGCLPVDVVGEVGRPLPGEGLRVLGGGRTETVTVRRGFSDAFDGPRVVLGVVATDEGTRHLVAYDGRPPRPGSGHDRRAARGRRNPP